MLGLDFVTAIADAISSYFKYITGRSAANQAEDVKAAEIAKQEQAEQDKANNAISKGDVNEIRNDIAE